MKKLMCVFLMLLPMCCFAQQPQHWSNDKPAPVSTKLPLEEQNALLKASRNVTDAEKMVDALREKEKALYQQIVQKDHCDAGISYDLDCLTTKTPPKQTEQPKKK